MAVFGISYGITSALEGGYANHPKDKGGETYAGISRKYHSTWIGWPYIDKQRRYGNLKTNQIFPKLNQYVKTFYTREFWDKLHCSGLDQALANQLFDYAVNSGKGRAVKTLQAILNQLGESLKVDGVIGAKSLAAIARHDQSKLAQLLHKNREVFLQKEAQNQPAFAKVWSNRLSTMKEYLPSAGVSFGLLAIVGVSLFFLTKN